jgi:FeS assembly SUF system protein
MPQPPNENGSPAQLQAAAKREIEMSEASEVTQVTVTASAALKKRIVEALKTVYDPEIPVDIYEMGLIYTIDVAQEKNVSITMTLTTPMCPVAETLPIEVEEKIRSLDGVDEVGLDLVWDPPWSPDMMSEAAKLELNM